MGTALASSAANDALVVGTEPWSIQGYEIRFGSREEFDAGARRTTPGAGVLPSFPYEILFSCGSCFSWLHFFLARKIWVRIELAWEEKYIYCERPFTAG